MVDTPDAVRRDIEVTRERMSTTLAELEQKVNVMQQVRDHPWAAIGIAVGAGAALGVASNRFRAPVAYREPADYGAAPGYRRSVESMPVLRQQGGRVVGVVDGIVAYLLRGLRQVAEQQIDSVLGDLRSSLTKPRVET
jgi:Protein of unknown function (DUF3618)/DUF883 C-terminal glycine zipper region